MTIANIQVQKYPSGIAINPATNKIYVANYYSDTVSVIDGATNTISDTVKVGVRPISVAVNPATNKIYVANYGDGTVAVMNGTNDDIIANLPVGISPYRVYHHPKTHIIYVLDTGSKTISQIKDTSLLAGITYNIYPPNSGQLNCNGTRISGNNYIKYKVGSEIFCKAKPSSEYAFRFWSANIPLKSDSPSTTAFKSSDFGNITANFQVPLSVNLPWEQLYILIGSIVIPAIASWSIPAIFSYINNVRQRKVLSSCMGKIIQIDHTTNDMKQRQNILESIRIDIANKLTQGKLSESQYTILNEKISDSLSKSNK